MMAEPPPSKKRRVIQEQPRSNGNSSPGQSFNDAPSASDTSCCFCCPNQEPIPMKLKPLVKPAPDNGAIVTQPTNSQPYNQSKTNTDHVSTPVVAEIDDSSLPTQEEEKMGGTTMTATNNEAGETSVITQQPSSINTQVSPDSTTPTPGSTTPTIETHDHLDQEQLSIDKKPLPTPAPIIVFVKPISAVELDNQTPTSDEAMELQDHTHQAHNIPSTEEQESNTESESFHLNIASTEATPTDEVLSRQPCDNNDTSIGSSNVYEGEKISISTVRDNEYRDNDQEMNIGLTEDVPAVPFPIVKDPSAQMVEKDTVITDQPTSQHVYTTHDESTRQVMDTQDESVDDIREDSLGIRVEDDEPVSNLGTQVMEVTHDVPMSAQVDEIHEDHMQNIQVEDTNAQMENVTNEPVNSTQDQVEDIYNESTSSPQLEDDLEPIGAQVEDHHIEPVSMQIENTHPEEFIEDLHEDPPTTRVEGTHEDPPTTGAEGTHEDPPTTGVEGTHEDPPTTGVEGTHEVSPTTGVEGTHEPVIMQVENICVDPVSTHQIKDTHDKQVSARVKNTPVRVCQQSVHSVTNARYGIGMSPRPDHSNDDTSFMYHDDSMGGGFSVYGVFDGHDGDKASVFTRGFMKRYFETKFRSLIDQRMRVEDILGMIFYEAEDAYFRSMKDAISEKQRIAHQLQGLTSYEAYMRHPDLVTRLQELEPHLSGGTTAVVAVLMEDTVYVANTGDSRAVLVQQLNDEQGTLIGTQLSVDHTVDNEEELKRLREVGLDPEALKRAGRLGSQENTRCIGDYQIKEGYKEVETISHAVLPPGIATPSTSATSLSSTRAHYLLLMTDGVYKSIENMFDPAITANESMNKLIHRLLDEELRGKECSDDLGTSVLLQLEEDHHKMYQDCIQVEAKQSIATQCRKRDDMTLMICQFSNDNFNSILETFKQSKQSSAIISSTGTPTILKPPRYCDYSRFTVSNERYQLQGPSIPDHANDDRYFLYTSRSKLKAFGVFDGHDGSMASDYASKYMETYLEKTEVRSPSEVEKCLEKVFAETEKEFFKSKRNFIEEKKRITQQLQGLTSYEAYMRHPRLVSRLQELEPHLSGGTTAVVAVLMEDTVYVANTGDSRAVLVQQLNDEQGTLIGTQLSEDHTTDNEVELNRLVSIGLNGEQLKRAGRLGSQENTRCIGDYQIKEGYKEVDTISHAKEAPGIAIPSIHTEDISNSSNRYLLLMTDGVYKSIENMYDETTPTEVMEDLLRRLSEAVGTGAVSEKVSERMLLKLKNDHSQTYQQNALIDKRSTLATQCRKRDDMTLIVIIL